MRMAVQEPLGAALYAVLFLKRIASTIPDAHQFERDAYEATAAEFEQAAVGLLAHVASSGGVEDCCELLLVRTMSQFFNNTALELARKAHARKFISSPQVQVP